MYFTYYFHTIEGQKRLLSFKSHVGVPALAQATTNFRLLEFPYRSLKLQKQIAKVLSDLDAKIEVNNKINQELEAMAKTLYDYWFVQFDFPDANGKPYKSSGGKMVFNAELKRKIPEGWEVDSFSAWIKNDKSGDWGKEKKQGNYVNKVSYIRGADLNGLNGKGEVKSPTRFILEKNNHKLLEIGDFIIEISGGSPTQSTGRMAFITKETLERFENPLICSNFCKAVTLKEEKALYNFAYEWNRLYDEGVLFGWEGKTSGIKNLLFESFVTNHQVSKPDGQVIELFYNKAKPIHAQIQTNLKQNQKLSELRDWLLPMLMNGQVTVGEVEQELGMVAEDITKYGK
ncbi:restriction endonuclease subunit S [Cellulophaga baltica]|nr:restriction endonuclease subunit S [Cellulophaga baltica]